MDMLRTQNEKSVKRFVYENQQTKQSIISVREEMMSKTEELEKFITDQLDLMNDSLEKNRMLINTTIDEKEKELSEKLQE